MAQDIFSSLPIFIPKLDDLSVFESGIKIPAALMELHHTKWRPKVAERVKEEGVPLLIDPVTVHLLYAGARNKKNFQKIGYEEVVPETLYSNTAERLSKVIIPAINAQLDLDSSILIAPSFYSEDVDDIKFTLNLTLLSETIRYMEENDIQKPLFASINLGRGVLLRPTIRNYIIDMYQGDFTAKISGYIITINDLDARKAELDYLIGYADLVFQLSANKYVFATHVGGFGELLSAIGASGFSSGLGEGETFSVKNLESKIPGFGRNGWTYTPEIFDYANDVELKKIGYKCSCHYCSEGIPEDERSKKMHFLVRRFQIMEILAPLDRQKRIAFLKRELETALSLAGKYIRDYGSPFKVDHLQRWMAVLDAAESWEYPSEGDNDSLAALLEELDKEE